MKIVVQKYGGSSLATPERIDSVATRIKRKVEEGYKVVVVASAMGKTTDELIDLAKSVAENPDPREMDMLLSTGEQISVALLAMALKGKGVKARSYNALQIEIKTTGHHTSARIVDINVDRIKRLLEENDVIVVTGFQGVNESGDLTTLGRGGSDTSAVALAVKLSCPCEIYSDVDGIYTCDPRLYPSAKKQKYITYDDILELTSLGAKVLHSRAVELAKKYSVELYCASSFSEEEGTYVVGKLPEWLEEPVVTGASLDKNQVKVTISNVPNDQRILSKIFEDVAKANINVDMISLVPVGNRAFLSFTIPEGFEKSLKGIVKSTLEELEDWNLEISKGFVKISVVGVGMRSSPGVAARFFKTLSKAGAHVELVTTSEIKISCLIPEEFGEKALRLVAEEFEL